MEAHKASWSPGLEPAQPSFRCSLLVKGSQWVYPSRLFNCSFIILGWSKSSFGFSCTISWKKLDELLLVAQSCPTLCDPMDCSLPGFSVHGILLASILEWIPFSRRSSQPRDWSCVSCTPGRFFLFCLSHQDELWGQHNTQSPIQVLCILLLLSLLHTSSYPTGKIHPLFFFLFSNSTYLSDSTFIKPSGGDSRVNWLLSSFYQQQYLLHLPLTGYLNEGLNMFKISPSSPGGTSGKEHACQCWRHKTQVWSLGQEDPLEEGMATHSTIHA